jgi:ABC-type nitrate/sulfonate/bicarbonate transport system substrate-binding protein
MCRNPDLMKMLGTKQVDATDLAYQFGFFAQSNQAGPIVAKGDDIDTNGQIGMFAAKRKFLRDKRDFAVRFAMAYLQGAKESAPVGGSRRTRARAALRRRNLSAGQPRAGGARAASATT